MRSGPTFLDISIPRIRENCIKCGYSIVNLTQVAKGAKVGDKSTLRSIHPAERRRFFAQLSVISAHFRHTEVDGKRPNKEIAFMSNVLAVGYTEYAISPHYYDGFGAATA